MNGTIRERSSIKTVSSMFSFLKTLVDLLLQKMMDVVTSVLEIAKFLIVEAAEHVSPHNLRRLSIMLLQNILSTHLLSMHHE